VTARRRVLITGIAGTFAGMVAEALEARDDIELILGVDIREPRHALTRTDFVRADIRNPLVAQRLRDDGIDTLVHLSTMSKPAAAGGRSRMKERNVISTMQLLAACQTLPALRRVVLKSTTAVYGSDHRDPAVFTEEDTPRTAPEHGFAKDAIEVESYVRAFAARREDVDVSVLRFANLVGGRIDSAFHSLFTLPVVPTVAGFDPRLQFCHEDDAVEVMVRVITGGHRGVVNVAGDGAVYLSQCVRMARHVPIPVPLPLVAAAASIVARSGRIDVPMDQLRFLQFGRLVDTTRLRTELGVTPRYSSREAFVDFVETRRIKGLVDREQVERLTDELAVALDRARRAWRATMEAAGAGARPGARSGSDDG